MRSDRFPDEEEYLDEADYINNQDYAPRDNQATLRSQLEAAERDGAEIAMRAQKDIDDLNEQIAVLKRDQTSLRDEPRSSLCMTCIKRRRWMGFMGSWIVAFVLFDEFHLWHRASTGLKWFYFVVILWPLLCAFAQEVVDRFSYLMAD